MQGAHKLVSGALLRPRIIFSTTRSMSSLTTCITLPNGVKYDQPTGLFINNKFVKSVEGKTIPVISPTTAKTICDVSLGTSQDIDIAVKAARAAFPGWKDTPGTDRGKIIYKFAQLLEEHADEIASAEALDSGKPLETNAKPDVEESVNVFRYYAGFADKSFGQTIETTPKKFAYTIHEPWGVCGQIIPWNYPFLMATWKIAPAVAAGNTIVLKPSEVTPLSILVVASLVQEAGFPPGVINIVNGTGADAGAHLASHMDVDKIAFTGSTNVGRAIMKLASANLKAVTLECGGKSPFLIFSDADLEQAAKWAHVGVMSNMGQICTATSRIYVDESVYEKFIEIFKHVTESQSIIGDPFRETTFQGPQVSKAQYEKVLKYMDAGKQEGARLVYGGHKIEGDGYFLEPTIFADVNENMSIVRDEIFGPVVTISPFKEEKEAIDLANNTSYGLGAAIFTKDISRAHTMAAKIEAGQIWINSSNDSDFRIPFGGYKMSGYGRELGQYGLETYTQVKAVHVNLGTKL